jgi:hypothetical protein
VKKEKKITQRLHKENKNYGLQSHYKRGVKTKKKKRERERNRHEN